MTQERWALRRHRICTYRTVRTTRGLFANHLVCSILLRARPDQASSRTRSGPHRPWSQPTDTVHPPSPGMLRSGFHTFPLGRRQRTPTLPFESSEAPPLWLRPWPGSHRGRGSLSPTGLSLPDTGRLGAQMYHIRSQRW